MAATLSPALPLSSMAIDMDFHLVPMLCVGMFPEALPPQHWHDDGLH